jgi:CelD/BcsL family acetyltransferase involved in cellulose biosynthesis/O-antigen/teichoic acid export membrane protein
MVSYTVGNIGYFAAVLLLAHWFATSDRAFIAFSTLSVLMLARMARLGMPEATSVYSASEPHTRRSLLGNQLSFMLVSASAAGSIFAGALALSGSHPAGINTTTLYIIAGGTLVYSIYESLAGFLVGSGRSKVFALTYPIEGWGWTAAIIAVHETSTLDPQRAVVGWLAAISVGASIRIVAAIRIAGVGAPSTGEIRRLVTFGFPAWIGGLATFLSYRLDQVLMGFISTREQLGLYAVAVNGSEVLLYVAMATAIALTPTIAQTDTSAIRERALSACRMVTLLTVACSVVGLVTGPFLLPIVFGQHNAGAVQPFMVLAASAVGWTTSVVLSSALLGAKASRLSALGSIAALLVGVALDIALIPPYGALGAAIATAAGFAAAGATSAYAFHHRFGGSARAFLPGREDVKALGAAVGSARRRLSGRPAERDESQESGGLRVSTAGQMLGTVRLDVVRTTEEFEALGGEWDALVRAMARPSPFLLHGWLAEWWRHYGTGARLAVVVARRDDGRLAGAAPMMIRRRGTARVARFLGAHESALGDLLLAEGEPRETGRLMVEALREEPFDYADVFGLPLGSVLAEASGTSLPVVERVAAPVLDVPNGWEATYESKTSSKKRNLHRRRRRQLSELGTLEFVYGRTRDELEPLLEEAFLIHDQRWHGRPDGSTFGTPEGKVFHRAAVGRLADEDVLRLLVLRVGGRPVAFDYSFLLGGAMFLHRLGFDPALARYSPGLVATLESLRLCTDDGATRVEFLGGDERYKLEFADRLEPLQQGIGLARNAHGALASRQRLLLIETRKTLKRSERLKRLYLRGWSGFRLSRSGEAADGLRSPD